MARFSQRVISDDRIDVAPDRVWDILLDPALLAELTPLVDAIDITADEGGAGADGQTWHWRLTPVSALGMTIAAEFTTAMHVEGGAGDDGGRIAFEPAPGATERAAATGLLTVDAADGDAARTDIGIDIVATVEMPLPGAMGGAVRRVMVQTMKVAGTRFARNMLAHLGDPPHRGLHVRVADGDVPGAPEGEG